MELTAPRQAVDHAVLHMNTSIGIVALTGAVSLFFLLPGRF
jgi:hypothetical protein